MDYFLILLLPPTFHSVVIATTDSNGVFLSILVDNRKGGRGGRRGGDEIQSTVHFCGPRNLCVVYPLFRPIAHNIVTNQIVSHSDRRSRLFVVSFMYWIVLKIYFIS